MVERCVMSEIESKAYVTNRSEKKLRDGGEGKKSIILGPLAQRPAPGVFVSWPAKGVFFRTGKSLQ
jgi:hypothetical protein